MGDLVTIKCSVAGESDAAYRCNSLTEYLQFWIPKSQIDMIRPKGWKFGDEVEIDIPRWLAESKDLEYEHD